MVVDDGLGLPGRGLPCKDARGQAHGHGHQAGGLLVRVEVGRRVAAALTALAAGFAPDTIKHATSSQKLDDHSEMI